jgi:hypothetical protein
MRERRGTPALASGASVKFPGYKTAPVETGWRVASTVVSPVGRALLGSRIDLHLHLRQVQVSPGGLAWVRASSLASGAGVNRRGCTAVSHRRGWEVGGRMPVRLTGRCWVAGSIYRPAGWHGHAHLHWRQAPVSIDLAASWRPVDEAGRSVRACEAAGEHLHLRQVQVSSGGLAWARACCD